MSTPNITRDDRCLSPGNAGGEEVHQQLQQQLQQQQHNPLFHGPSAKSNSDDSSTSLPAAAPSSKKKKRNLPGTPDPTAEVIALSPKTLMATNRFICEICNKGFQRDQNLQLHRRGHNLPWKLRQRASAEVRKRVYVCPEATCVHHNPSRALGDLTGIKKHFCRKHGEKKWKCDKCSKKYAVQSDLKAHSKTCGTREYRCDCDTVFSRRDSFITHRAFCDALAEENNKALIASMAVDPHDQVHDLVVPSAGIAISNFSDDVKNPLKALSIDLMQTSVRALSMAAGGMFSGNHGLVLGPGSSAAAAPSSPCLQLSGSQSVRLDMLSGGDTEAGQQLGGSSAHMSATVLLQKAAQMGATASGSIHSPTAQKGFVSGMAGSYIGMQPHVPYESLQPPGCQQLAGVDGGGLGNPFFGASGGVGSALNGVGMLWAGGNNNGHVFFRNVEQENSGGPNPLLQGSNGNAAARFPQSGGPRPAEAEAIGGGDMTTVDFLGVGGAILQEQQRLRLQHRQRVEVSQGDQQRLQGLLSLPQQQQLLYGQAAFDKLSWDV